MALTLHQLRKRAATFALAAAIAAMSAGCSQIETDVTQGWDADRLYEEARAAAEDSDWTRAQDYYTKLESRYPFGRYAQQAQIESAYAYWRDGDAAQCVQACDRFLRQYPNHANSDYVLYLKALATLNQRDTIFTALLTQDIYERDSDAARTAFDCRFDVVIRYRGRISACGASEYSRSAFPRQYIERKFCHQCRQYAGKSDRPHSRWRSVRALGIGSRSDFEHRLLYRISHYGNIYTYSIYPS